MASIDGTTPRNWPPGFKLARIGAQGPVDQADVGHDQGIDGNGDVELAGEIVELVHRPLEERDAVHGFRSQPIPGDA